jgi:NADH-quinone oxidoreductase subunit F
MSNPPREKPLTGDIRPGREPLSLRDYEEAGGYQALRKALQMAPEDIQEEVKESRLRGRGGAGFPTGEKWSGVPMGEDARHPKYVIINADEMEPGTMKDRLLMEGNPHQLIEGAIITAYAVQAGTAYIFLRWAYKLCAERLSNAIAEAYERGYLGADILGSGYGLELRLHVSAGRYMCGEEDGLLDALEGKRPIPRPRPPYAVVCGLWGKPTVANNVETVCCVPHIVNKGSRWFRSLSYTDDGGTKIFGASGRVKRPGLFELPLGTPVREVLEEHAGGMREGYSFRGLLPGGASTGFLTADQLDLPLDFAALDKAGVRLGTGTMVVLDDRTCPVGVLVSLERFFARESCGWCTPCREGLPWVARTLEAIERGDGRSEDMEVLSFHVQQIRMHLTFCALAPGAMLPLAGALKHFRQDFERHIAEKRCPWR